MRIFLSAIIVLPLLSSIAEAQTEDLLPDDHPPITEEMLTPDEQAITPPSDDVPLAEANEPSRLDELFGDLKRAANSRYAETIANQIWSEWFRSGSATTDLMMHWANEAVERRDFNIALDLLDQVVTRQPDFAEGWNRRATLHFMMDNYAKSMSDIHRTLALEPRHFGALSGMAMILERNGQQSAAREVWLRTLEVYPGMENAQNAVIRLEEDLAGDPA